MVKKNSLKGWTAILIMIALPAGTVTPHFGHPGEACILSTPQQWGHGGWWGTLATRSQP